MPAARAAGAPLAPVDAHNNLTGGVGMKHALRAVLHYLQGVGTASTAQGDAARVLIVPGMSAARASSHSQRRTFLIISRTLVAAQLPLLLARDA